MIYLIKTNKMCFIIWPYRVNKTMTKLHCRHFNGNAAAHRSKYEHAVTWIISTLLPVGTLFPAITAIMMQ